MVFFHQINVYFYWSMGIRTKMSLDLPGHYSNMDHSLEGHPVKFQ